MKSAKMYVIYEEVPHPAGHTNRYYHTESGDLTLDPKAAKKYTAENWIKWIIIFLELILKVFSNKKLKYQEIK